MNAPVPPVSAITSADEQDALSRLSRLHGPASLAAAVLAVVARWPQGSSRTSVLQALRQAWAAETAGTPNADEIDADVAQLSAMVRLPCLEALLLRVRQGAKEDRRALLRSTRRVLAARAPTSPMDRLLWFAMRRQLGEQPPRADGPAAHNDLLQLAPSTLAQIAVLTAHLSRLIPGADGDGGANWYTLVLARVMPQAQQPDCAWPDGDALANALIEVQTLPWMLRPVLVRAWVDAAAQVGQRGGLSADAIDALRLVAGLLDSPLPPTLSRRYAELRWPN